MTEQLTTDRETRGQTIAQAKNQIQFIEDNFFTVKSQSGNGEYAVSKVDGQWLCQCPDNKWRQVKCKHIFAVEFSLKIKEAVKKNRIIEEITVSDCIYCHSSNTRKFGVRHNTAGDIQRFLCADCGKTFSVNIGFERMKHNPQAITAALSMYFSGASLRNTTKSLRLLGVKVCHRTVFNWIQKYVRLMKDYAETLTPNVSDTWAADEIFLTVKGNMKYLFSIMDSESRLIIAQEVAETKEKHDARQLFITARRLMGKQPKNIITDGLPSYSVASKQIFPNAVHIRHIRLQGDMNNNRMERLNGEIRDREKTMRGLKKRKTPILQGYAVYHNFFREHEALNGKTPAEACGIKVEGENKWLTLIQNASQNRKTISLKK